MTRSSGYLHDPTVAGESFASMISRMSRAAAEMKFSPSRNAVLSVDILGQEVEAYLAAEVAKSVTDAAALFAKAIQDPRKENARITNDFRRRVGIRNIASTGNHLVFGFPSKADDPQTPLVDESQIPSLGETSARNLAVTLPCDAEDDSSLDSVMGLALPERSGLSKLSEVLAKYRKTVRLELNVDNELKTFGVLTSEQAKVLYENLKKQTEEQWIQEFSGRLDGMRSRRRQFYLELKNEREISGVIGEDLIAELPKYIDKQVNAVVTCRRPSYANGRSGRVVYRLDSIQGAVAPADLD
ncbi:hypothetical protein CU043_02305 [Corynebacterium striatum]|nr:hypothetical protein [Corynebacterium striatum]